MSNFITDIHITHESSPHQIIFLDLTVHISGTFYFSTYQKSANIYQYLSPTSANPTSTLKGFIIGELKRYCRSNTDRVAVISDIYLRLLRRGFTTYFLDPIFLGFDATQPHLEPSAKPTSSKPAIMSIPFNHQPITVATRKFILYLRNLPFPQNIPKLDFDLAYSRNTTLPQLTSSTKLTPAHVSLLEDSES